MKPYLQHLLALFCFNHNGKGLPTDKVLIGYLIFLELLPIWIMAAMGLQVTGNPVEGPLDIIMMSGILTVMGIGSLYILPVPVASGLIMLFIIQTWMSLISALLNMPDLISVVRFLTLAQGMVLSMRYAAARSK